MTPAPVQGFEGGYTRETVEGDGCWTIERRGIWNED